MELQGQLEIMKVQQAEFGHCGQGNSLFGEVRVGIQNLYGHWLFIWEGFCEKFERPLRI